MSDPAAGRPLDRPVIVVGGGAAGLMAALHAARAGASTLLLEGSRACGRKILISGGGRCNVLPSESTEADYFTTGSRAVLRRIFRTWPLLDVHRFFERDLSIPLVEEAATGKVFPAGQRAREVRDALVDAVCAAGAVVRTGSPVRSIQRRPAVEPGCGTAAADHGRLPYEVRTADGRVFAASRVILATGGKSVPSTGSDGAGYGFAAAHGHTILEPYPALVPLCTGDAGFRALAGIALPVEWTARTEGRVRERRVRELLFTHRGFSGPAILDASHWAVRDGATIEIDWAAIPREAWGRRLAAAGGQSVGAVVSEVLPRRLAEALCRRAGAPFPTRLSQLPRRARERLLDQLCASPLPIGGNEGFRKAEVTGGGVPLREVNPSTLESRCAAGLHLCGEILDVIGRIGGYNFYWAWVTGRLAGEQAALAR